MAGSIRGGSCNRPKNEEGDLLVLFLCLETLLSMLSLEIEMGQGGGGRENRAS